MASRMEMPEAQGPLFCAETDQSPPSSERSLSSAVPQLEPR